MKATLFISAAALFSSALAFPTIKMMARQTPTFMIQLADDMTGANNDQPVEVDAGPITFGDLFGGTNLDQNGTVIATSVQNITPGRLVSCSICNPDTGLSNDLDEQVTWADLDGNPNAAIETDVTNFTIECTSDGA